MLSRKSKDKSEGVVGKYVKKETPEIPGIIYVPIPINMFQRSETFIYCIICIAKDFNLCFGFNFSVINVWTIEKNKNKTKSTSSTNANIIQATNQKFGTNGKIPTKPTTGLGHEGKYTPKYNLINFFCEF